MKKEKVLQEIKKNFDRDLKKKLNPLYDIEQEVHKDTLSDLKELFEAVGDFAYDEAKKEVIDYLDDLSSLKNRLVEEGIHQRKPISVVTLNKIFGEVNRQIKQSHLSTLQKAKETNCANIIRNFQNGKNKN